MEFLQRPNALHRGLRQLVRTALFAQSISLSAVTAVYNLLYYSFGAICQKDHHVYRDYHDHCHPITIIIAEGVARKEKEVELNEGDFRNKRV